MVYYEIKKVFSKMSSKLTLVLLCIVLIIVCNFTFSDVTYTNENGEMEKGITAAVKLKEEKLKWEGVLTKDRLARVILENAKSAKTMQSEDVKENNLAFRKVQGMEDIRMLLSSAFSKYDDFDYFKVDSLRPKDAETFYSNRILNLQNWLNDEKGGAGLYTEAQKSFLLNQYKALEIPLTYEYADGFKQFFQYSPMLIMITMLIIGFLVSGIFSCETQLNADSVFYAAYHGRKKAVRSKLNAGLMIASGIYWLMVLLYSGIILGILGSGGSGCMIQSLDSQWGSPYNITVCQEYLLILFGGYIGCLFLTLLTMLVSAKTRTAVLAAAIPFILLFIPNFLDGKSRFLDKILGLFPDQILQIDQTITHFKLYTIAGNVIGSAAILMILYLVFSFVIYPILYQTYRRAEVK